MTAVSERRTVVSFIHHDQKGRQQVVNVVIIATIDLFVLYMTKIWTITTDIRKALESKIFFTKYFFKTG